MQVAEPGQKLAESDAGRGGPGHDLGDGLAIVLDDEALASVVDAVQHVRKASRQLGRADLRRFCDRLGILIAGLLRVVRKL